MESLSLQLLPFSLGLTPQSMETGNFALTDAQIWQPMYPALPGSLSYSCLLSSRPRLSPCLRAAFSMVCSPFLTHSHSNSHTELLALAHTQQRERERAARVRNMGTVSGAWSPWLHLVGALSLAQGHPASQHCFRFFSMLKMMSYEGKEQFQYSTGVGFC